MGVRSLITNVCLLCPWGSCGPDWALGVLGVPGPLGSFGSVQEGGEGKCVIYNWRVGKISAPGLKFGVFNERVVKY